MGTVHSKLGASSAYRWFACPASVRLCEGIPNQSSDFAAEGTRAHDLASDWLLKGILPPDDTDDEMLEAITVYVNFIQDLWKKVSQKSSEAKHFVEHKFELSKIHPALFGTADDVIYDAKDLVLYVTDYKHGAGIPVDPEGNSQLMYYGLGALLSLGVPVDKIVLTIVQPRYNTGVELQPGERHPGIKQCEIDALELLEFSHYLREYALATESPDAKFSSGEHCRFCSAQAICPKVSEDRDLAVRADFQPEVLHTLTPEALGELLPKLEVIENWCKAVRKFAYLEAKNGKPPVGWKLVAKVGRRKWADTATVERELKNAFEMLGEDASILYTAPELKSPTQVEKVLPKELKSLVNKYAPMVSSGDTLEPESDKREAIKPLTAAEMFGEDT